MIVCKRCGNVIPRVNTVYCSRRCQSSALNPGERAHAAGRANGARCRDEVADIVYQHDVLGLSWASIAADLGVQLKSLERRLYRHGVAVTR